MLQHVQSHVAVGTASCIRRHAVEAVVADWGGGAGSRGASTMLLHAFACSGQGQLHQMTCSSPRCRLREGRGLPLVAIACGLMRWARIAACIS